MTAQKYTQGPWVFEDYSQEETEFFVIPATYHGTVAKVFREEDARLIAASPAMLEALKECLPLFDMMTALDDHGSNALGQAENLIRAAIAKATGQ